MSMIREKKHRLPREYYEGLNTVAFTLCVKNRIPLVTDFEIFAEFEKQLLIELGDHRCDAHVYLFMPDHGHLVLGGQDEESRVLDAVDGFKQRSGYWLSKNRPKIHWQKDYYDHSIRRQEEIEKQIRYVLDNPVRKGLVDDWKKYPF